MNIKRERNLALVLHRTSDMNSFASGVRRCRKADKCHGDFNRHTGSTKRRRAGSRSQTFQSFGIIALGGWLERSPDDARRDGVDTDTLGRLLLSECASEARDGALGCAVVDHGRVACVASDGTAVDDDGAAEYVKKGVFADRHHGDDVELEGLLDDFQVDVLVVHANFLLGG